MEIMALVLARTCGSKIEAVGDATEDNNYCY